MIKESQIRRKSSGLVCIEISVKQSQRNFLLTKEPLDQETLLLGVLLGGRVERPG